MRNYLAGGLLLDPWAVEEITAFPRHSGSI